MAAFKPIDPKRDEFRRYLERKGVIEALTKVFVQLIRAPERPEDPIAFLCNNLGDARLQADNVAFLRSELDEAHSQIENLRDLIQRIDPFALSDGGERPNETGERAVDGNEQRLEGMKRETLNNDNNASEHVEAVAETSSTAATGNDSTVDVKLPPTIVNQTTDNSHITEPLSGAANASTPTSAPAALEEKHNNLQA